MTIATTAIEIERPKGWKGEPFDFGAKLHDFEVEVEGQVHFWTDNYGADADGNRGVEMEGCDVEDLEFTLYGDFRPTYIKVRDIFYVSWRNARYTYNNLRRHGFSERGLQGWWEIHRKNLMAWTQFSNYYSIRLDAGLFSEAEIEEAVEGLKRDAEEYDGDLRDFDEDAYYERKLENLG